MRSKRAPACMRSRIAGQASEVLPTWEAGFGRTCNRSAGGCAACREVSEGNPSHRLGPVTSQNLFYLVGALTPRDVDAHEHLALF